MSAESDRELLELAAKAAGLPMGYADGQYFYCEHGPFGPGMYGKQGGAPLYWNPLADDGDALRLAVKLCLSIDHNHPADQQRWVAADWSGCEGCYGPVSCVEDDFEDDSNRSAATRRAIVRAAAAIGRAIP